MAENEIAKIIVDAALQIHKKLGSGLLESVYEVILVHELKKRGVGVERQNPRCLIYGRTRKGRHIHVICAYSAVELLGIVITVYEPDPEKWSDFLRRKQ